MTQINAVTQLPGGGVWSAWTPTWTGFSSNPIVTARYTQVGKLVFANISLSNYGTSNANTLTLTLPVIPLTSQWFGGQVGWDNTVPGYSFVFINAGTGIAAAYYGNFANWTTSGNKAVNLSIFYEAA